MLTASAKAGEILDLAERYIRTVGYNGFSFRHLADDAGIKSASVHYHFPTKERLVAAVASRYCERFFAILGDPANSKKSPEILIKLFVDLFRKALREDGRICLFCVLGAEHETLPSEVQAEVRQFYSKSIEWLSACLERAVGLPKQGSRDVQARARTIIAALEGAMIVARGTNDLAAFDTIVGQLEVHGVIPAFSAP